MSALPPPDLHETLTAPESVERAASLELVAVGGRFEILRRIGEGGMGVVYEAIDRDHGAHVALKTLRTLSPDGVLRMKREFRALADLQHPNLVRFAELFEHAGQWFFTMELLPGEDFLDHVRPGVTRKDPAARGGGVLDEPRLRAALGQLARGLVALHDAGKVHRDLKPSNVLVTPEGRVVILDFGIVASVHAERWDDIEDELVGTCAYMAPEQARGGAVGVEADWYSVGVMLYESLTGQLPHVGRATEVLAAKQLRVPFAPREHDESIPVDLDRLAMELLRIEPEERPTGRDVMQRLRAHTSTFPPAGPSSGKFVGRAHELAQLHAALDATRGPSGRAVTIHVHGESGVGKSTLARRFANDLEDALVFEGRCYEREWMPYKAFDGVIDALSRYLARERDPYALLPPECGLLGIVFPVLRGVDAIADSPVDRTETLDPQNLRQRVFAALRELFTRLTARAPVVLVIDDMQWADADSIALLSSLLQPPQAPPLLLVATSRARTGAPGPIRGLPIAVRDLPLGSLPIEEAEALAEELLRTEGGPRRDDSISPQAIAKEAAGHPLFIDELVRARAMRSGGAPLRLDDALGARIDRLDAPTQRVLRLVALAGMPLELGIVARAADGEEAFAAFAERVAYLRGANFVRTSGARRIDTIEPYHDRVRETVARRLDDDVRRELHQGIAVALEASGRADPESLAVHWRAAGDRKNALAQTLRAAARAAETLAFDRAAALYEIALELHEASDAEGTALRVHLADALANAGRGKDAARAYLAAAAQATEAGATLDLRRRAADQLLRSGEVDEAIATLDKVLGEVGMSIPKTQKGALVALLVRRTQVRMRGLGFRPRSADQIPPRELLRVDTAWAVGSGLGLVDTIVGSFFTTRGLLLALDSGEPNRVCRAIASEAAFSSAAGCPTRERTARLVKMAAEMAQGLDSPYATAWTTAVDGMTAALEGRWKDAYQALARAETTFAERCTGVAWELGTLRWFKILSAMYLGRIDELARIVPARLNEARARGDLYAEVVNVTGLANLVLLASDEPARARTLCVDVMKRWSREKFHVEHWWAMQAEAHIDLYEGRGLSALATIESRWPALKDSLLLMCQMTRTEALHVRARAELVAANEDAPRSKEHCAMAERWARAIAKERMPWSDPLASLLRAALASFRGDATAARSELDAAIAGLDAADMPLFAAAARWRRGELQGGDAGRAERGRAEEWLLERGIVSPARMVPMLAPWKA